VDTLEFATGNRQVPGPRGAHAESKGVVVRPEIVHIDVPANVGVGDELDPLLTEHVDTTVDRFLLEFHVWDPVHEQSTDPVSALVHGDLVSQLIELIGARQSRRTGPDDRNRHAGPVLGDPGLDESVLPGPIDDGVLNVLDRDGRIDEAGNARTLTRGGTNPPGELREIIRLVESVDRLLPLPVVHEVVPLGNEVVDGTSRVGLAEGGAAVHAPGGLDLTLDGGVVEVVPLDGVELSPVHHPLQRPPVRFGVALVVDKAPELLNGSVRSIPAFDPAMNERGNRSKQQRKV